MQLWVVPVDPALNQTNPGMGSCLELHCVRDAAGDKGHRDAVLMAITHQGFCPRHGLSHRKLSPRRGLLNRQQCFNPNGAGQPLIHLLGAVLPSSAPKLHQLRLGQLQTKVTSCC